MFPESDRLPRRGARRGGLRFALVLLLFAVPAAAQWTKTAGWTAQPFEGEIAPARSDPHRVYACTGSAAVLLISDDGGATWRSISTKSVGSPGRLAVDPLDADTIYAVMSKAGDALYKSSDAGATFSRIGDYTGIAIDPQNPGVLYAARSQSSGGGIAKSIDGGRTWFDTARTGSVHGRVAVDPNDSRVVYANGWNLPDFVGAFYRTLDGGLTWPSMFSGSTIENVIVDAESRVYVIGAAMFEHPLLRSTNHGDSWTRIDRGMPSEPNLEGAGPVLTSVAFGPQQKETIYVSAMGYGVYVSFDDGAQWQFLGDLPDRNVSAVAVSGSGAVLAATPSGIYRWVPPPLRRRAVR